MTLLADMNKPGLLTLSEQDVSDCCVNIVVEGVTTVDHEAICELHGLGSLAPQLAGDNHFTALGSRLHDETQDTITRPSNGRHCSVKHFN